MNIKELRSKYKNRYVELSMVFNYQTGENDYTVIKSYKDIHENTTMANDVETPFAYTR